MMKKLLMAVSLSMMCCMAAQANFFTEQRASNFTYNFVELEYVNFQSNLDGFNLNGSYDVLPNLSVIGSVGLHSAGSLDLTKLSLGAVYHAGAGQLFNVDVLNGVDMAVHLQIESYDYDSRYWSNSEVGLLLGVEGRYRVLDDLEAYADISIDTSKRIESYTGFGGRYNSRNILLSSGIRYQVLDKLLLTAGVELSSDHGFSLGARYNF